MKKNRILSFLLILSMVFTCIVSNTPLKVFAAGESIYTTKGAITKIYASAFAQNTDDWAWMSMGDTASLVYQDATSFNVTDTTTAFAKSNATANFGIQITDGNLAAGDSSTLKFHVGTVTIKATGYADTVINLNKDYTPSYLAETATWGGLTGNGTQILLNSYLPTDATAKAAYLKKITGVTADITLSEYLYTKAVPVTPTTGQNLYTTKGAITKISASAFAQNGAPDYTWMSVGSGVSLVYQDVTSLNATTTAIALAKTTTAASFGINISDENLADGDSNILKFHVGTVTVKATGYADLVINLNKDYSEAHLASKVSWGLTGNTTQILLNSYLPKDPTQQLDYIKKVTGVKADITLLEYTYFKMVPPEPEFPADYTHPTEMRDISAMDLVDDMKVGINLGNTLESTGGETGWGNPITKRTMIDEMKKAGFNTLRIPVRWDENYTDANYTIDPAYMARVETVVNYALVNGMYAILNIHHNKIQGEMNATSKASVIAEGTAIWTQVATHFKDYGDKLIFETINEPRNVEDWTGTTENYQIVNEFNAKTLSAMRATGGNNAKRLVMMPTYCASADYSKISAMVVPTDTHVAVSIHAYMPYDFALNEAVGSQSTFGDADKIFIDKTFRLLNKTFKQKGIPVVMGEFAAVDKNNLQDRINFTKYYLQTASSYKIPCLWWDNANSGMSATNNAMALFNRKTLKFIYPEIEQALFDGWSTPRDTTQADPNVMFSGIATSSAWGQSVSLNLGLDFVDADFTNKYTIAVDNTSTKAAILILKGNLTGTEWVLVPPSITQSNGTTNTSYFTLSDMVTAYKKALLNYDSYGKALPGLQAILVGDQGANMTVTKVYKIPVQTLEATVANATINGTSATLYVDSTIDNTVTLAVTLPAELKKVVDAKLSIFTVSYKSSNLNVATVSATGKITPVGIGTATITTTVTAGTSTKSFTTTITVKNTILGDVDGNGLINSLDSALMKKYLVRTITIINKTAADVNHDGKCNVIDYMLMKKLIK